LFLEFARWIDYLKPKAFIIENVKGILSRKNSDNLKVIDIIQSTFIELGYFVEVWLINALNYGVPQSRERVFIVGNTSGKKIGIPTISHSLKLYNDRGNRQLSLLETETLNPAINLWDAISDLPLLNAREGQEEQSYICDPQNSYQTWIRDNSDVLYNHVAMEHSARLVERFRRRSSNGELSSHCYDQNNRRLNPYEPSHTITASFYANFLHPFQNRNLTAREGARLQSFPDQYRFLGKKTVVSQKLLHREKRFDEKFLCQYNQIGNAVPPLLARSIALHIKEKLNLCPKPVEIL
jgi:DNA (cytosine-5)-methyltransferase 1